MHVEEFGGVYLESLFCEIPMAGTGIENKSSAGNVHCSHH
jgi:hypothetical protein